MAEKWPEGPYYVTSDGLTVCSSATDDELAAVFDCEDATVSTTNEQAIALAHLFAASPMLYEALQDARDFIATTMAKIGDGSRIAELVQDFDYALCRARGETK